MTDQSYSKNSAIHTLLLLLISEIKNHEEGNKNTFGATTVAALTTNPGKHLWLRPTLESPADGTLTVNRRRPSTDGKFRLAMEPENCNVAMYS